MTFKALWKNYNLSIVLFVLFIISWWIQTWVGWMEFRSEEQAHGQVAQVFGDSGYIWSWAKATFENWQSEFLQLFTFVVFTTFLIHKGSHESRDTDDEMMNLIKKVDQRLQHLESKSAPKSTSKIPSGD